jgi:hypothetical protein
VNWLCWHVGTVTDPKFRVIARRANTQPGSVVAIWAYLLELAGSAKERGSIASFDAEIAEEALGYDVVTIRAVYDELEGRGLIEGASIAKWKDRQNLTNAERAKEWRKSKAERNEQNDVRKHSPEQIEQNDVREHTRIFANATDIQTGHTDIQTDKERIEAPQASPARTKASRLPDDWQPEPDLTIAPSLAERELPKFRDYWRAKSGKDAAKLDWQATWRNWCRRAVETQPGQNRAGTGATQGAVQEQVTQWRARLRNYKPRGFWPDTWGNRPEVGNPLIPPDVYADWRDGKLSGAA